MAAPASKMVNPATNTVGRFPGRSDLSPRGQRFVGSARGSTEGAAAANAFPGRMFAAEARSDSSFSRVKSAASSLAAA